MTSQQVGLLAIQLVMSLGVLSFLGVLLLHNHESKQKYRLFAVRDEFLLLAATNVISEKDLVFKVFYRAMNTYIKELDSVTIVSYMRASTAVKTELEKENHKRLSESLQRADPEVQAVVNEFFHVVLDALRYNSPMLNILLALAHHCTRLWALMHKLPRVHLPIYETYRYYETTRTSIIPVGGSLGKNLCMA
jgi:hypothetical protein